MSIIPIMVHKYIRKMYGLGDPDDPVLHSLRVETSEAMSNMLMSNRLRKITWLTWITNESVTFTH